MIPNEVKSRITDYIGYLEKKIIGVKWEREEKTHITLKFIGDIESSLLPDLKDTLYNTSQCCETIPLKITGLSAIPNFQIPRVIILALNQSNELSTLYNSVQENIEKLGINKDTRSLLPHITIGRVKGNFKMSKKLDQIGNFSFYVNEIALIKSELTKKGSIYSYLGVYKLT